MKKLMCVLAIALIASLSLWASFADTLEEIDLLDMYDRLEEEQAAIEKALKETNDPVERSELYWRLSKVVLHQADELEESGASDDELFALFEAGEKYADTSLSLAENPDAYIWKASNIGRWGETKGPLNALGKANPIKDTISYVVNDLGVLDRTIGWYVIGQLYFKLPGWPLSYGDLDTAISMARKAIDTIPSDKLYHGHYKALAEMLYKRDWSVSKRSKEIKKIEKDWKSESDMFEKHFYYEGAYGVSHVPHYSSVALNKMSDRQEAAMLLMYAQKKYDIWPIHSRADKRTIEKIENLLEEY